MATKQKVIIIGAGPGGLTAGLELLVRSGMEVVILEGSDEIGGISRTVNFKGNRIDIGGHRFFSKSQRVLEWWSKILPTDLQSLDETDEKLLQKADMQIQTFGQPDKTMLLRNRVSRIFYKRKFFDYPINLNFATLKKLGAKQILKIGLSYCFIRAFPIKVEISLEDFLINRFGRVLYQTFFKDYTEKVWGISCKEIKPEWGAQRIKGLSISKALKHYFSQLSKKNGITDVKKIETSLIEKFMYPKFGPGQLWEEVAQKIEKKGGKIHFASNVSKIDWKSENAVEVTVQENLNSPKIVYKGNYLISTMPVKDLIASMDNSVPDNVKLVAKGLEYRDFITVGVLLKNLKIEEENRKAISTDYNRLISDNWIYIQENDVKLGRLQIFNNWSPFMVSDKKNVWIGMEYFCNEGDSLWNLDKEKFIDFALKELVKLKFIEMEDVLDTTVIKVPKAYPAYFGSYHNFDIIRDFTDRFHKMFLIGRNGMHKYNNQDHSMLTAMVAVDNIMSGETRKDNIWEVNTEADYHESKKTDS
ncbi:NAD(P)/FAD-dependent oxidoreductase [Pedobacter sp. UBA5917]|jgi:protoporphyrinogen oxidase|uniref:NAD(P)/FAD-dependent oxidoreductase n=1 Tax=Pedobacter sp. UBA5917 TaxID=1947061 RepID=UPI0025DBCFA1|nr:NAD(P)/FAD-dependent oxidoreductase [Pedobacter sp. UBA5917]